MKENRALAQRQNAARQVRTGLICALAALLAFVAGRPASGAQLPGMGGLAGRVTVKKPLGFLTVYAFNTDKDVGYMVYVVGGKYRATNLFPGHYDVTLRGTVGQLDWSLPQQTAHVTIAAGKLRTVNFGVAATKLAPTYIGGMAYQNLPAPYVNAKVVPYNVLYPPGRGRDVIERLCFGCHTANFYPYNAVRRYAGGRPPFDKAGWAGVIDLMSKAPCFNVPGNASCFDPMLLPPADRAAVIDYLATNFGAHSVPRVVEQENQPALDARALEKAEFVEYRFLNQPGETRFVHTPDFDGRGNVWITDVSTGALVEVDPRTGHINDHRGLDHSETLTVDTDGTIWYGGLDHYDPKTNLQDKYRFDGGGGQGQRIGVSTAIIDSHGDIWLSLLPAGGVGEYVRKTDSIVWWRVPVLRSHPYGITLDHNDKVWFADYHNSGVTSFDPTTGAFRHYQLTIDIPTNIRRPAVDLNNFVWASTWGSRALMNAALYRVDPTTGEVTEHKIGIPYTNPYDAEVDLDNNVWVATDNHLLMFDQKTNKFTRYPLPERTDVPKLAVTRDGAIWFGPRNAGEFGGYGGSASVLYPDKDHIKTFGAYYFGQSDRDRKALYGGPGTPIKGVTKLVPAQEQNPGAYANALGVECACASGGAQDKSAAPKP
jgi:streptogramin lyase